MKIDEGATITTSHQHCDVSILVTSIEEYLTNQTVVMQVQVSVHHLMTTTDHLLQVRPVVYALARPVVRFRVRDDKQKDVNFFPLRSKLRFIIEQFDENGRRFDASSCNIELISNR